MNLSYGSQGDEVKKLQEALNGQGYGLSVDGIYGAKTQAAVRDYQSKNGLSVDGIAGVNTQGKLYDTQTAGSTAQQTTAAPVTPTYETPKPSAYQPSAAVEAYKQQLQQQITNKPGQYQSQYQQQLDDLYQQITGRKPFSFDAEADALYQQYKDQYQALGKEAMADAMGQAAALTGGYGNSYAQNVGQQAYQSYLQGLNDKIPELYQLALDRYDRDGQELYDQLSLIGEQENQDYSRYRDDLSDFNAELDRLWSQYVTERDADYDRYADERDYGYQISTENRKYAYDTAMTMIAAGLMPGDQMLADAGLSKEDAQSMVNAYLAQESASGGGSGGGGGSSGGGSGSSGQQSSGYTSGFQQATGSYRNSSVGTLFTAGEYKTFQQQVGMCRGTAGRAAMIDDAFNEGKITGQQASETLKAFGISEAEFDKLRGYN